VYCHCIILCIVIVHHCVLSLYIIVYCIILCIVIVYHCALLLYVIVYCYCMSLCIVIVRYCVLYYIVYCHCIVLCIVIVMLQYEYNIVTALVLRWAPGAYLCPSARGAGVPSSVDAFQPRGYGSLALFGELSGSVLWAGPCELQALATPVPGRCLSPAIAHLIKARAPGSASAGGWRKACDSQNEMKCRK